MAIQKGNGKSNRVWSGNYKSFASLSIDVSSLDSILKIDQVFELILFIYFLKFYLFE